MDKNLINQNTKKYKYTYVFNEGRSERLNSEKSPKDFFYFYSELKKNNIKTGFIELQNNNSKNIPLNLFMIFEKIFIRFFQLPFYGHKIISNKNIKKLLNSENIIITNETVGYSMYFISKYIKFRNPKVKIVMIVMGLFDNVENFSLVKKYFFNRILKVYDKFIFLGNPEYKFATKFKNNLYSKFFYLPFAIDYNFWKNSDSEKTKKNIIFVGNDLNRDYGLIKNLTTELKEFNFIIVSNKFKDEQFDDNVKYLFSDWRNPLISDFELRDLFDSACLSLIPTLNTLQPSGQSVGLQSMSMNIPIIASVSKGFWGDEVLENNKDIVLLKNDAQLWKNEIIELMKNTQKRENLSINAYEKLKNNYKYEDLFERFFDILKN